MLGRLANNVIVIPLPPRCTFKTMLHSNYLSGCKNTAFHDYPTMERKIFVELILQTNLIELAWNNNKAVIKKSDPNC